MAIGAWRISQKKVLTRQFPAIEMLGAATVICVDKTGTLTENRMAVQEVFVSVSPQEHAVASESKCCKLPRLASEANTADPVDKAVIAARPEHTPPGRLTSRIPAVLRLHAGRESL